MNNNKKRFVFLVQGEGRGHLTQAIGLSQIFNKNGHEVVQVFIGKSKRRVIPEYFLRHFNCPVTQIDSPNFISDDKHKTIKLIPSILYNARLLHIFRKSLRKIDMVIRREKPDGLVNFYDFLGGFYMLLYQPDIKYFCIAHHFLTDHPDFPFAKGKPVDKFLFKISNNLTSIRAYKKIALSYKSYNPNMVGKTIVTPPLLRNDLHALVPVKEDFLLCYMVNPGYGEEIINWHKNNRKVKLHCFWDMKNEPDQKVIHPNLIFHQLNALKFMDMMCRCKGFVTTAGFESVCEAMYLDKPVMMVPVDGQYEQACNAIDATRAGAGISSPSFMINLFIDYLPGHRSISSQFKEWYGCMEDTIIRELTDF